MAETIAQYPYQNEDGTTAGDVISLSINGGGLHVAIAGKPFTEERTSGDLNGDPKQIVKYHVEVPKIVPFGATLSISVSAQGIVTISQS